VTGGGQGSGSIGTQNLILNDEFTTAVSAPLPDTRNAVPGPGALTVYDPLATAAITSGALTLSAGTMLWHEGVPLTSGLVLVFDVTISDLLGTMTLTW
jgi:hypothetical protein